MRVRMLALPVVSAALVGGLAGPAAAQTPATTGLVATTATTVAVPATSDPVTRDDFTRAMAALNATTRAAVLSGSRIRQTVGTPWGTRTHAWGRVSSGRSAVWLHAGRTRVERVHLDRLREYRRVNSLRGRPSDGRLCGGDYERCPMTRARLAEALRIAGAPRATWFARDRGPRWAPAPWRLARTPSWATRSATSWARTDADGVTTWTIQRREGVGLGTTVLVVDAEGRLISRSTRERLAYGDGREREELSIAYGPQRRVALPRPREVVAWRDFARAIGPWQVLPPA